MKKITFWLFALLTCWQISAQVNLYSFSQSSGAYTEITGGTVLGTSTTATSFDSQVWNIADGTIPFNFNFNNTNYTGCNVNSNGYITFGTTAPTATTSSALSSTTAYSGAIAAWSGDLCGVFVTGVITGEVRWEVVGTAPNREFVIQFKNWRPTYSSSTTSIPFINFQFRLSETSNVAKIVYGSTGYAAGSTAVTGSRQIGLRGATNTDYLNRTNPTTSLFTASTTGTTNAATQAYATVAATPGMPTNGLTYTYTPPAPCNATPAPGNTVAPSLACFGGAATLTLQNQTIGTGISYQWYSGSPATPISGATSSTYTIPSVTATETYYCAVTCANTSATTNSNPVDLGPIVPNSPTTVETFATYLPGCWSESKTALTSTPAPLVSTDGAWGAVSAFGNATTGPNVGNAAAKINIYGGTAGTPDIDWLVSPLVNLGPTAGLHRVRYKVALTSYNGQAAQTNIGSHIVRVVVSTDGINWSDANVIKTYTGAVSIPNTGIEEIIDLTAYSGKIKIGFLSNTISDTPDLDFHIDDFKVEPIPTCPEPISLSTSNVLATTADVSWEAAATAPTPDFEYTITTSVTPPAAGNATTQTFYSLTGLANNTQYYLHVRTVCAAGVFSPWATLSFTTKCPVPTAVTVTNITTTTATVNFNGIDPSTGFGGAYQYIIQTSSVAPLATATGTVVNSPMPFANPIVVNATGLMPSTTYYVFVKTTCDASNSSAWTTGVLFNTLCATVTTFPVLEPFNTYLPSTCWAEATGGDTATGFATLASNSWTEDGFGNVGTTGAARYNIYQASQNAWLVSPSYLIPTNNYELKYDAAAVNYAATSPVTSWNAAQNSRVEVLVKDMDSASNPWSVLFTYNETSVPAGTGTNKILSLAAYANKTIRIAYRVVTSATAPTMDIDFSIDNFEIRETPATAPLCAVTSANVDTACGNFATAINWAVVNGASGYRITAGTTAGGTDIANNVDLGNVLRYNLSGTISTTYYYTVVPYNAIGAATGCVEMSFTTVATGCYCPSVPTSNDASGITNVQIGTTNFPIADVTYSNQTATTVAVSRGLSTATTISFATGYTYNTYIYIDYNNDYDYTDDGELVYTGESLIDNPTNLSASFTVPGAATLGVRNMRIVTADALSTGNPCYSGSYGVTVDFKINIIQPACTPPTATATVVPNCGTSKYTVNVNVTNLGSGSPSVTDGVTVTPVTAPGVIVMGPYDFGTTQNISVPHGTDTVCNVSLGSFTYTICPPVNDDLCNAIELTVIGTVPANGAGMTVYNNTGATVQTSEPQATCYGGSGLGSVWFKFVATAANMQVTTDIGPATGTDAVTFQDTQLAIYDSTGVTCGTLSTLSTAVGCDDDGGTLINFNSIVNLTGLTVGRTYYAQVEKYGSTDNGTFKIAAVDATLGSESFDATSFMAYPNPVKNVLNLSYSSEITNIKVVNILGQEVLNNKGNANQVQIDMAGLNAGTYLVTFTANEVTKTIKIVKQ